MTTENWREEFEIVWQMSVDHISDNRAGCYGKMDMVKKEMGGFISTLLSKERNKNNEAEFNRGWECALDEVKKEVEKQKRDNVYVPDHTPSMHGGLICRACGGQEDCFCSVCNEVLDEISTIIENLKNN